jgi:hypothetical protein
MLPTRLGPETADEHPDAPAAPAAAEEEDEAPARAEAVRATVAHAAASLPPRDLRQSEIR